MNTTEIGQSHLTCGHYDVVKHVTALNSLTHRQHTELCTGFIIGHPSYCSVQFDPVPYTSLHAGKNIIMDVVLIWQYTNPFAMYSLADNKINTTCAARGIE